MLKKLFPFLFKKKEEPIRSITTGEVDENGYAFFYVNGEKTNVRTYLWDKQEVERLRKLAEKHNEQK